MDENRLLATEHGIPWRLPRDVAHFRSYTANRWLLMGRKTYEEMMGWFREGHMPLVLSAQCGWDPEVGRLVSSVPHALALAEAAGEAEVVCVGGGQTFATALPYADKMVLTLLHHRFDLKGPLVHFPPWKQEEWREVSRKDYTADAEHAWSFSIVTLERVA
jgi:dihydrofolate reductase